MIERCPVCLAPGSRRIQSCDWRHYGVSHPVAILGCRCCGALRHSPRGAAGDPTLLHGDHYAYRHVSHELRFREAAADFHRLLRPRIEESPPPGRRFRLLEIGCSHGYLLAVARELGHCEVHGLELDVQTAATARAALALDVRPGTLEEHPDIQTGSMDCVVLLDVLEHVMDPRALLANLRRTLRPDGVLIVETPQVNSLVHRVSGRDWIALLPHHPILYTRKALHTLLADSGLQLIHHGTHGNELLGPRPWNRFGLAVRARRLAEEVGLWPALQALRRRAATAAPTGATEPAASLAQAWESARGALAAVAEESGPLAGSRLGDALTAVARRVSAEP